MLFRGVRYNFTETVILDKGDSGSKNHKITYTAYPGEKPILPLDKKFMNNYLNILHLLYDYQWKGADDLSGKNKMYQ